jgi:hypothetical protein
MSGDKGMIEAKWCGDCGGWGDGAEISRADF